MALTYKKDSRFKSFHGGLFTIVTLLSCLGYFCFQLGDVWNQKSTSKTTLFKRNLTFDKTAINLTLETFDFALSVFYLGNDSYVPSNLDEYIDIKLIQNEISWDTSNP